MRKKQKHCQPLFQAETRNEIVDGLEAPLLRSPIAAGITPQEHKGNGAPITAAFVIEAVELLPMWRSKKLTGTNSCIIPATSRPSNSHGADSINRLMKFCTNSIRSVIPLQTNRVEHLYFSHADLLCRLAIRLPTSDFQLNVPIYLAVNLPNQANAYDSKFTRLP